MIYKTLSSRVVVGCTNLGPKGATSKWKITIIYVQVLRCLWINVVLIFTNFCIRLFDIIFKYDNMFLFFSVKLSPLASSPSPSIRSRSSSRSPIRYVQDDTLLSPARSPVSPLKSSSDEESEEKPPPPQPAPSNSKKRKASGPPPSSGMSVLE